MHILVFENILEFSISFHYRNRFLKLPTQAIYSRLAYIQPADGVNIFYCLPDWNRLGNACMHEDHLIFIFLCLG